MSNENLILECKIGLSIPVESTEFNHVLGQKIMAVKSFMKGAGVSDEVLEDDLSLGVIVLGVTDLWNLVGGETKFSTTFMVLMNQLAIRSS